MVNSYPIVSAFHESFLQEASRDAIHCSQLSLPYSTKLRHMKITPATSDKYLVEVYKCVEQFMKNTLPHVPFVIPREYSVQIEVTVTVSAPELCMPSRQLSEEEYVTLDSTSSNISILFVLVKLSTALVYIVKLTEVLKRKATLTEKIERWRILKMRLIEFSKFIDEVLQRYRNDICILPDVDELRTIKNTITKLISRADYEDFKEMFGTEIVASNVDLVTTSLGLNGDVAAQLCKIREGPWNHQTDQYHITDIVCGAVEENCDRYSPETDMVEILVASGFSYGKASLLSEQLQKDDLSSLQPLKYWVDCYLAFMFDYDIFLSTDYTRFPCNENIIGTWFNVSTVRLVVNEHTGDLDEVEFKVQVYNSVDGLNSITRNGSRYPPREETDGVWYHGTTHKHAESIRNCGIVLKKGRENQDFSNGHGFYLTPHVTQAMEWARKKGGRNKGALIVFKHKIDATKYAGLDLSLESSNEKWCQVVKQYRNGEDPQLSGCPISLARELHRIQYIEGPMSGDGTKRMRPHWNLTKKENSAQLCIKSMQMANDFSRKIDGIIFFIDE